MTQLDPAIHAWIDAAVARHTASYSRPEFLKAVRALSARYVEQRASLPARSVLDSAGKRAAFAGFYAPLHLLTAFFTIRELAPAGTPAESVIDLGCGTGVAAAAWALATGTSPRITGVDLSSWALDEARWNWRSLNLRGRSQRGDLIEALDRECRGRDLTATGFVCGWSLNELPSATRGLAFDALLRAAARGARVLVIEPLATSAAPWWPDWVVRATAAGARADTWRFSTPLPAALAALDRDAGFDREALTARRVYFGPAGIGWA